MKTAFGNYDLLGLLTNGVARNISIYLFIYVLRKKPGLEYFICFGVYRLDLNG